MEDPSEMLVVVRLNCGEPISVSASHPELANIPVVFVESSALAEELGDDAIVISDDEIIALTSKIRYEDLEDLQDQLEDSGAVF